MSLITIDGNTYNVGTVSLSRSFELVVDTLTQGEMLDFSYTEDIAATRITYSMSVQPRTGRHDDYDAFVDDITAPKNNRIITVPYGQGTLMFEANVSSAGDSLLNAHSINKWGGCSVKFKPIKPQRYAEDE